MMTVQRQHTAEPVLVLEPVPVRAGPVDYTSYAAAEAVDRVAEGAVGVGGAAAVDVGSGSGAAVEEDHLDYWAWHYWD